MAQAKLNRRDALAAVAGALRLKLDQDLGGGAMGTGHVVDRVEAITRAEAVLAEFLATWVSEFRLVPGRRKRAPRAKAEAQPQAA